MSRIFGYIGNKNCQEIIEAGLSAMSYYANIQKGITLQHNDELILANNEHTTISSLGIGQIDDYTYQNCNSSVAPATNRLYAVCIDGEINDVDINNQYSSIPFRASSDGELLLNILCSEDEYDSTTLLKKAANTVQHELTFAFISAKDDCIFCHCGTMPLIIGIGDNEFYVSSQLNAIEGLANRYIVLRQGDSARLSRSKISLFDSKGKRVKRSHSTMPENIVNSCDYSIFDAIHTCPLNIKSTINYLINNNTINLDYLKISRHFVDKIERIIVIGSGKELPVAIAAGYAIGSIVDILTIPMPSEALLHNNTILNDRTLVISISNDGEEKNTIYALLQCKKAKALTISITSNPYSQISRLSDSIINPLCELGGDEATLCSFITSYLSASILALYLGRKCKIVSSKYYSAAIDMIKALPPKVIAATRSTISMSATANTILSANSVIISGDAQGYAMALEASYMMQKMAGIDSTPTTFSGINDYYPAKLYSNCTIICIITNKSQIKTALRSLQRTGVDKSQIIIITTSAISDEISSYDNVLTFNDSLPILNAIPAVTLIYNTVINIVKTKQNSFSTDIAV